MYCTHCGHKNPPDANFCAQCGRPMAAVGDATTGNMRAEEVVSAGQAEQVEAGTLEELGVSPADLEPGTALLVVTRGPNSGARFLLDRDVVTVGRHPDSDIFLDDITVSRRHAEFRREGHRFWVHDAGSLNGTYVNGSRVDDQALASGDEVQVGKFKLMTMLAEPVS